MTKKRPVFGPNGAVLNSDTMNEELRAQYENSSIKSDLEDWGITDFKSAAPILGSFFVLIGAFFITILLKESVGAASILPAVAGGATSFLGLLVLGRFINKTEHWSSHFITSASLSMPIFVSSMMNTDLDWPLAGRILICFGLLGAIFLVHWVVRRPVRNHAITKASPNPPPTSSAS